jgi:nucleoid-associated protein YgaU
MPLVEATARRSGRPLRAGRAPGAGKGAALATEEGTVAGRKVLYSGIGLFLALGLALLGACATGPVTPAEPTPTPGAHFLMPTPMAPVSVSPHPTTVEMLKYIVQEGDTLYDIALRYDLTVDDLIEINKLKDPNNLRVGQELLIPLAPRETATPVP